MDEDVCMLVLDVDEGIWLPLIPLVIPNIAAQCWELYPPAAANEALLYALEAWAAELVPVAAAAAAFLKASWFITCMRKA